jgi:hypothetical protein
MIKDYQPSLRLNMGEMAFELCRQLVISYTPSGFDSNLVSRELLFYALGHREPDCREIALYVLDDYLSVTRQNAERVFAEVPEHLQNELFQESARRFRFGSRFASKTPSPFAAPHGEFGSTTSAPIATVGAVGAVENDGPGLKGVFQGPVKDSGGGAPASRRPAASGALGAAFHGSYEFFDGTQTSRFINALEKYEDDEPQPTYDESTWLPQPQQPETETILVIHGTWAKGKWWLPGSPFVDYLDSVTDDAVYKQPDQFQWTGCNLHRDRLQAGRMLAKWLISHPYVTTVIAHSHGGNVAIVASHNLSLSAERVIQKLVLLGTPSRSDYTPVLRTIGLLRNIYSFADLVQTPTGTFPHRRGEGRTVSDSRYTLNIVAGNGGLGPGHSDLHEPSVWKANQLDKLL